MRTCILICMHARTPQSVIAYILATQWLLSNDHNLRRHLNSSSNWNVSERWSARRRWRVCRENQCSADCMHVQLG